MQAEYLRDLIPRTYIFWVFQKKSLMRKNKMFSFDRIQLESKTSLYILNNV